MQSHTQSNQRCSTPACLVTFTASLTPRVHACTGSFWLEGSEAGGEMSISGSVADMNSSFRERMSAGGERPSFGRKSGNSRLAAMQAAMLQVRKPIPCPFVFRACVAFMALMITDIYLWLE